MKFRKILILLFALLYLTGCKNRTLDAESIAKHTNLMEESYYGKISKEFTLLSGEDIRTFNSKQGKTYEFSYSYLIKEGTLELQFRDSKDNIITNIMMSEEEYKKTIEELTQDGIEGAQIEIHEFCGSIKVKSNDKKIKIVLIGDEAKGKVNITW